MEAVAPKGLKGGDDFLPLFMREIGDYAALVDAKRQDLMRYAWNGGPIEILFVDVAKSWELTNALFRGFGRDLIPKRSRIVLQDFRYHGTHWLPLIFDSRPDLWREIESVENGWTATFTPLKPLYGRSGIHTDYMEESFPLESAEYLLRKRMERESRGNRHLILRSLYRKYVIDGTPEEAQKIREELVADGVKRAVLDDIEDIEFALVPRGWRAYEQKDYASSRMLAERCLAGKHKRSVHAVALLGMSLLQLRNLEGARRCIEEVVRRMPDFLPGRLYQAELALAEGRYVEAQEEALYVLKGSQRDESTIAHSLMVLRQAWAHDGSGGALKLLTDLARSVQESPTYLAYLAQEQFQCGRTEEAMKTVQQALDLAPGHELAAKLKAEWSTSE